MCLYQCSLVQARPNLSREEQQALKGWQSHNIQLVLKISLTFVTKPHIQNIERMLSNDVDNFECKYINTCLRKARHQMCLCRCSLVQASPNLTREEQQALKGWQLDYFQGQQVDYFQGQQRRCGGSSFHHCMFRKTVVKEDWNTSLHLLHSQKT